MFRHNCRGDEGGNQSQVAQPQSLVLSPETLQAIISSFVCAALANLNLNGAQQQSAPTPAVRLSDRIEILQKNHKVSEATALLLATNKLKDRAREWYNSQAVLVELPWAQLKLKSQNFKTTEELFAMKSYTDELPTPSSHNSAKGIKKPDKSEKHPATKTELNQVRCYNCNQFGHYSSSCTPGTTNHLSTVEVKIRDHEFSALIDSGCTANIVREVVPKLLNIEVEPNNEVYMGLGSSIVPDSAIPHDVIIGEPFFTMATVSFGPNGTQIKKMVVELESEVRGEILNITLEPQQSCVPKVNMELKAEDHNRLDQLLQKLQHPEPTV
ncbi:hypothetical protein CBL_20068 [Carabus blaptoides fortunei]